MAVAHPHPPRPEAAGHLPNGNVFNKTAAERGGIRQMARIYRNYGVGLAFGPDDVIGVDLDWIEPAIAARAWDITKAILGETPLVRIGRPPKKLALYRRDPGLVVGKAYGGFELFTRSGQCVLFGIHPDTGQPYRWLTDTPATLGPADLPLVTRDQIFALIDALEQLDPETTARHRARVHGQKKPGITTDILRALQDVEDAPAGAAKILAAAPHGKRHNTMVGATLALAMRGYSDAAIFAALDDAYYLVNDLSIEEASDGGRERHPLGQGMRRPRRRDDHRGSWRRPSSSIAAAWNRRWGRE